MRAILIDPFKKTVLELNLDASQNMLDQWYKVLDASPVEVAHYIDDHDSILVDEEGLLKPCDHFFTYQGAHQPFAGRGLVVGCDNDGNTVSCTTPVEDVLDSVRFLSRIDVLGNLDL